MTKLTRILVFLVGLNFLLLPWCFNMQWQLHLLQALTLSTCLALTLSIIGFSLCIMAVRAQQQQINANSEAKSNNSIEALLAGKRKSNTGDLSTNLPENHHKTASYKYSKGEAGPGDLAKNNPSILKDDSKSQAAIEDGKMLAGPISHNPASDAHPKQKHKRTAIIEGNDSRSESSTPKKQPSKTQGQTIILPNDTGAAGSGDLQKSVNTPEKKSSKLEICSVDPTQRMTAQAVTIRGITPQKKSSSPYDLWTKLPDKRKETSAPEADTAQVFEQQFQYDSKALERNKRPAHSFPSEQPTNLHWHPQALERKSRVLSSDFKQPYWRHKFRLVEFLAHIFAYKKGLKHGSIHTIDERQCIFDPLEAKLGSGLYGSIGYDTTRARIYLNFQGTRPGWLDTIFADLLPGGPGHWAFKNNSEIVFLQLIKMIQKFSKDKIDLIISGHSLGASLAQHCFCALLKKINAKSEPALNQIGRIQVNVVNDPGVNKTVQNEILTFSSFVAKNVTLEGNIILVAGDAIQQIYPTALGYLKPQEAKIQLIKIHPEQPVSTWGPYLTFVMTLAWWMEAGAAPASISILAKHLYQKLSKSFAAHTKKLLQDMSKTTKIEFFSNLVELQRVAIMKKCGHQCRSLHVLSHISGPIIKCLHTLLYPQPLLMPTDLRYSYIEGKEGWVEITPDNRSNGLEIKGLSPVDEKKPTKSIIGSI